VGLAAAHGSGVVHRDVKPDNLYLVGPPGEPHGMKVLDFGMAKVDSLGAGSTDLVMGTVHYMAPEQIVLDVVDARTDVYSLGVVMFRMFTGQLPFDTVPGTELLGHQLFSPAPPPSWLNEAIDPRLEAVMLRALRKHPDNRYDNMDQLVADLEAVLGINQARPAEWAPPPLKRDPDVYTPENDQGRRAAAVIARRFGGPGLVP
jgi:serine/threonine-protein kinase